MILTESPSQVRLEITRHRNVQVVALLFEYDKTLINIAKAIGCYWSQSKKFWYLPYSITVQKKLFKAFKGTAWVDASALHHGKKPNQPERSMLQTTRKPISLVKMQGQVQKEYSEKLNSRRYSQNTISTY